MASPTLFLNILKTSPNSSTLSLLPDSATTAFLIILLQSFNANHSASGFSLAFS